jgi:hypothetical protein
MMVGIGATTIINESDEGVGAQDRIMNITPTGERRHLTPGVGGTVIGHTRGKRRITTRKGDRNILEPTTGLHHIYGGKMICVMATVLKAGIADTQVGNVIADIVIAKALHTVNIALLVGTTLHLFIRKAK